MYGKEIAGYGQTCKEARQEDETDNGWKNIY